METFGNISCPICLGHPHSKTAVFFFVVVSFRATLAEICHLMGKNNVAILRDTKPLIYTPKRDDEHPRPFHMGVPPGL